MSKGVLYANLVKEALRAGNLPTLRAAESTILERESNYYALVDEGVIPYNGYVVCEFDSAKEMLAAAIEAEEKANAEALYWEYLELRIV